MGDVASQLAALDNQACTFHKMLYLTYWSNINRPAAVQVIKYIPVYKMPVHFLYTFVQTV